MNNLYNKYAPKTFKDVCGQEMAVIILQSIVRKGLIHNGILFTGIHGVGKTLLARIFAQSINCISENNKPCMTCDMCVKINKKSEDIIEIDGATYTGVDNIRKIIEDCCYLPLELKYKVYIIDEVHMLSRSAFDALLMTLQEPPSHVKFLFATTRPDKLPDTFLSRCLCLSLNRVGSEHLMPLLSNICEKESKIVGQEVLDVIAKVSDGSVRTALSLLELILIINDEMCEGQIDTNKVFEYLKIFSPNNCLELLSLILDGKPAEAIEYWKNLYNKGYDERSFLHSMSKVLTNLSLVKLDQKIEKEEMFKDIIEKYNISFNLLINFWEILIAQTEAMYSGCHSLIETTIIMFSLIEDKTDLTSAVKRTFFNLK